MRFARLAIGGSVTAAVLHEDNRFYELPRLLRTYGQETGHLAPIPDNLVAMAAEEKPRIQAALDYFAERSLAEEFVLPHDAPLLAPLPRPTRILAIGRNYAEHAKESGAAVFEEPIVFLKASTSVIGPDAPIEIPDWIGRVDYEGELLVVLGRGGKNVAEADAMSLVAGYTIFNDVTARALQRADQERKHPWFRSKSIDTFGPLGPWLVTADEVPDPHALRLTLSVNGQIRQDDNTGSMVYRIPVLIAFLSKFFALEPGDVIATGTPSGIGPLAPGDTVEVSIDGLGTLRNPVVRIP